MQVVGILVVILLLGNQQSVLSENRINIITIHYHFHAVYSRSPNCIQIWLTGVYQYGQVFDGFFITSQRNVSKNIFSAKNSPNGMSQSKDDIK